MYLVLALTFFLIFNAIVLHIISTGYNPGKTSPEFQGAEVTINNIKKIHYFTNKSSSLPVLICESAVLCGPDDQD